MWEVVLGKNILSEICWTALWHVDSIVVATSVIYDQRIEKCRGIEKCRAVILERMGLEIWVYMS